MSRLNDVLRGFKSSPSTRVVTYHYRTMAEQENQTEVDDVKEFRRTSTGLQRDILYALDGYPPQSGQELKPKLERMYGSEVSHGRLYPNIDRVVEAGMVEKEARDRRTNEHSLTEKGERFIRSMGFEA